MLDVAILAERIRHNRVHGDPITRRRRAICRTRLRGKPCPEHEVRPDGSYRCRACHCADPTIHRPRCPAGWWGVHPASGCIHLLGVEGNGGVGCELGLFDCAGCPRREVSHGD